MKCIALFVAALLLAGSAGAAERTAAFEAMLQRFPALIAVASPEANIVFQDFRVAAEVSLRGQPPASPASEGSRPRIDPQWFRLVAGPFSDSIAAGLDGDWQSRVGFGPDDIDALLSFTNPPGELVMIDLDDRVDHAAIGAVLLSRGYAPRPLPGWSAWIRGEEDFRINLRERDPADPFGGNLGRSARVASDRKLLLYSSAWTLLEFAATGSGGSLGDDRPMQGLLAALNDDRLGEARLVQAMLLTDPWPAIDPRLVERGVDMPPPGTVGLARWQLGLMADLSTGAEDLTVVALAYPTRGLAEAMAERLEASWPAAKSMVRRDVSFAELFSGETRIFVAGEGPAALVLSIRRAVGEDPGNGQNLNFSRMISAWAARDLAVLGVE